MHERFEKGGPLPESIGALADLYGEARELRLGMQKVTDAVKDREVEIYKAIMAALEESPDSGASGQHYRVQLVDKDVFSATDWQALHSWIAQFQQWQLLQKRLLDSAVKEMFEEYGQLPPGIDKKTIPNLSFSKVG